MPCRSPFRKALPRRPVASVDGHTATVTAQLMEPHVASVAGQITGLSNVEALGRRNSSSGRSPSPGRPQNRQKVQWQQAKQRQGTRKRKQRQAEIYSQKARQWPWQRRRQILQDERPNSYWSFRITTPSQS